MQPPGTGSVLVTRIRAPGSPAWPDGSMPLPIGGNTVDGAT
ncbi:hypothetical protein ACFV1L_11195 [Kitasatospora sp. NPDC059646]